MKRLAAILNWMINNNISIESIHFDEELNNTLIMYNKGNNLIELNEKDFIYYENKMVKRFSSIRTEEILKFLNKEI